MPNSQQSSSGSMLSAAPMITGIALVGAGSLVGLTGLIVGGTALFQAARKWFLELDMPASEVAKQKWDQTLAATVAGAAALKQQQAAAARPRARV